MKEITIGLLNNTEGSAKFINGDTIIVAGVVGVPATWEVAISASILLGNYFLRQGMLQALSNCCQV